MSVDELAVSLNHLQVIEDEVQRGRQISIKIDTSMTSRGEMVYDVSVNEYDVNEVNHTRLLSSDCNLETFEDVLGLIAVGLRK